MLDGSNYSISSTIYARITPLILAISEVVCEKKIGELHTSVTNDFHKELSRQGRSIK